ncbi:hypothetical protein L21SP3_00927 [Sedimentisphaera cyanobacteriorum]|uniref:General secretion pathway, M protein n=1 Tax=Sedimentisphaera cyanobacteriorum TaxID=1940790 RepID=A0A1Q2HNU8_9BACT|nr:type 4a pilus biogenesis protein PilO [Sedimentisphaera cyanobacteriorum]AQQ09127.1 hypothetical protein L21SP3_00927 [Sedimentisphaera cyanobacteriorum]
MDLSLREKRILIIALLSIAVLVCDKYIISPGIEKRTEIISAGEKNAEDLAQAQNLIKRKKLFQPQWKNMQENGLTENVQQLESRLLDFIDQTSSSAGLDISFVQPDVSSVKEGFGSVDMSISGKGSIRSVTQFMYAAACSDLPVRMESFQLGAANENGTEISIQIDLSALFIEPSKEDIDE